MVTFSNEELGLAFPFPLGQHSTASGTLSDVEFIRVAFPKYVERPLLYDRAVIATQEMNYPFEIAEDINAIAFKVLQQRMLHVFGKSLLRVALKKGAEYQVRKQNDALGAVLGVVNAATEKADTRNWQTIPHSIYYTRVKLPEGEHQVTFKAYSRQSPDVSQYEDIYCSIREKQTCFYTFNSVMYTE